MRSMICSQAFDCQCPLHYQVGKGGPYIDPEIIKQEEERKQKMLSAIDLSEIEEIEKFQKTLQTNENTSFHVQAQTNEMPNTQTITSTTGNWGLGYSWYPYYQPYELNNNQVYFRKLVIELVQSNPKLKMKTIMKMAKELFDLSKDVF